MLRLLPWVAQCGKFQPKEDFDADKRSCRARLEKHNARRRRQREVAHLLKKGVKVDPKVRPGVQVQRGYRGSRGLALGTHPCGSPPCCLRTGLWGCYCSCAGNTLPQYVA